MTYGAVRLREARTEGVAEPSWILRDDDDLVGDAERVDFASQSIEKGRRLAQAFKSGHDDAELGLGHRQRANYRARQHEVFYLRWTPRGRKVPASGPSFRLGRSAFRMQTSDWGVRTVKPANSARSSDRML